MRRLVALALVAAAVTGCANVDSSDLRTSGVIARMTLVASGGHTVVDVHLGAGGLTDVVLAEGESLRATAGSHSVVLQHVDVLGDDYYSGTLDVGTPGTPVTVALKRVGANADAPSSTVVLPRMPVIRSPRPHARIRVGRDLEVRTAGGAGILAVAWTGSCLVEGSYDGSDSATSVVVPAGSIGVRHRGRRLPRLCLATLSASRTTSGALDPAYRSGSIVAIRRDEVVVRAVR